MRQKACVQLSTSRIRGACSACFTPPATLEPHVDRVDALAGQYLTVARRDIVESSLVRRVIELVVTECQCLDGVTQRLDLATAQRVVVAVAVDDQSAVLKVVDVLDIDLRR